MASIPLQMHETPWLPCSLAPARRLYTSHGRRFSTMQKLKSSALMINKHLMKKENLFQEAMSKKCPYSFPSDPSFASLVPSFLNLLLPVLMVSLLFSLFSPTLQGLILFPFYSRVFFWFLICLPTPCSPPLHFASCISLFLFLFLYLFIETAANLRQGYWQRAGPGFARLRLR